MRCLATELEQAGVKDPGAPSSAGRVAALAVGLRRRAGLGDCLTVGDGRALNPHVDAGTAARAAGDALVVVADPGADLMPEFLGDVLE